MVIPYSSAEELAQGLVRQLQGTQVVDSLGLPKTVLHGTGAYFESFSSAAMSPGNLHGAGFYFTEDPSIASGYARSAVLPGHPGISPHVGGRRKQAEALRVLARAVGLKGNRASLVSMEEVLSRLTASEIEAIKKAGFLDEFTDFLSPRSAQTPGVTRGVALDTLREARQEAYMRVRVAKLPPATGGSVVKMAYLNIKNALDLDQRIDQVDPKKLKVLARIARQRGLSYFTPFSNPNLKQFRGMKLSEVLSAFGPRPKAIGLDEAKHIRRLVMAAGYDGLSHTGGVALGGKAHKVWIALDKRQILPAFWRRFPKLGVYGIAFMAAALIGSWLLEDRDAAPSPMGV